MNDKLSGKQIEEILTALNNAIERGPWDQSNFLKAIGKNLVELRDNFISETSAPNTEQLKTEAQIASRLAFRSGQQEIFVSLYSVDGNNMQSWERILTNLPRQIISRPVYAKEEDVKEIIKSKSNKHNEAYASIYINQTDILLLPDDRAPTDRLGKKLLSLKDKTIQLENLNHLVHISGVYELVNGRLIKTI